MRLLRKAPGLTLALLALDGLPAGPPPVITRHPVSQRVLAGHATLLIGGTSDPQASFSWEKFGVPLPGRTTTELAIPHALPGQGGDFQLIARNRQIVPENPLVGETASRTARVSIVVPIAAPGGVDLDFGDASLSGGDVRTLVPIPDGGVLAGGSLTVAGTQPVGSLVRLRPDGTLDADFHSLPGAAGGRIRTVVRHRDGWLVGGDFTSYHGQPRARLARLAADGTLDPGFIPPSLTSSVRALAVQPLGDRQEVLVGLANAPWLLRLREDGKTNPAFNPAGINGRVNAIAVAPDGGVVIAGDFYLEAAWPFRRVGRLHPDGRPDTAGFRNGPNSGADSEVLTLALDSQGRILVGGTFTTLHGQSSRYLAGLLPSGDLIPGFSAQADDFVHAVTSAPNGSWLVAGRFTRISGQPSPVVARLLSQGVLDPAWRPASFDATADAVAVSAGGRVFVGGSFRQPHRRVAALRSADFLEAPRVLADPENHAGTAGQAALVTVPVLAPPGSTFAWRKLGTDSPVATTPAGEWLIPLVTPAHAGTYTLDVSSPWGNVSTAPFEIAVHPPSAGGRPHWHGLPSGPLPALPDQGTTPIPIPMPAVTADEVLVTLSLRHRDTNDLVIDLRAPGGKTVRLVDPDEPAPLRSGQDFDLTVLADQAEVSLNDAAPPYVGTYRPSAAAPGLAALRGPHPAGTWSLIIQDRRDDGIQGEAVFVAIDVLGPRPVIDAAFLSSHPLPASSSELEVNLGTSELLLRHWQPLFGAAPRYERAESLPHWSAMPSDAVLQERREDDQRATVRLRLPPPAGARHGFFRARWP